MGIKWRDWKFQPLCASSLTRCDGENKSKHKKVALTTYSSSNASWIPIALKNAGCAWITVRIFQQQWTTGWGIDPIHPLNITTSSKTHLPTGRFIIGHGPAISGVGGKRGKEKRKVMIMNKCNSTASGCFITPFYGLLPRVGANGTPFTQMVDLQTARQWGWSID